MNWSWDNIRYFLAVAKNSTLVDAARELGVSHTTVQRRVTAFEKQLQSQLLARTKQGYKMTAAGELLFEEASKISDSISSLSRKISGKETELTGPVVITSTDTLCSLNLPEIVGKIISQYPGLDITVDLSRSMSSTLKHLSRCGLRIIAERTVELWSSVISVLRIKCAQQESVLHFYPII